MQIPHSGAKKRINWFFYLLFCLSLFLTWFFNRDVTALDDPRGIWSDRAGYYIYLPATFFYHFDTERIGEDLDIRTGGGFSVDKKRDRIETKYTCGVALMESPFFLTAWLVSQIGSYDHEGGFSMIYFRMLQLSGVIWFLLGAWFLKRFLDHYFSSLVNYAVILLLFAGTNLFYYVVVDGLMSHVYSFFLFSFFLYHLNGFNETGKYRHFLLFAGALALAILVRPTNALLGITVIAWDVRDFSGLKRKMKTLLQARYFLVFLAILLVVLLPQMIYWKYLSGHWLHFSYKNEGFSNLAHPKIAEVLFSPVNGLLLYTPLLVFCLAGLAYMIIRKKQNGVLILLLFVSVTLISASWKTWNFGCSYGQRNFTEYLTVLAVPLAWLLNWMVRPANRLKALKFIASSLIFFLIFYAVYHNLRYVTAFYRFDRCYFGSSWHWERYVRSVRRAGILQPLELPRSYNNDFENMAILPVFKPSEIFVRSGQYSVAASLKTIETPLFEQDITDLGYPLPKRVEVVLQLLKPGQGPTGAFLAYRFKGDTAVALTHRIAIDQVVKEPLSWTPVFKTFIVPDVNDSTQVIELFIENPKKALLFADDLDLIYRYDWNP